jgi:PhzF family phenazine biosynthesis protein
MKVQALKVNSFTANEMGGNPAGVVLEPGELTAFQMKKISRILQVSETAFVFPSDIADFHVRFFSPAVEVDLCGHATIATFTVLAKKQITESKNVIRLTQETKAGVLPVKLHFTNAGELDFVLMQQQKPVFEPVSYSPQTLANVLNISVDDLCLDLPQKRVSTGLFTLPVCVSSFSVLKKMKPDFRLVKRFCRKHQVGSLHVFTFDTLESDSLYHARNFAPIYDIDEDPVTGTANGAVCSYLRNYGLTSLKQMVCEQGDIIGRNGRVRVSFLDEDVWVGGNAVVDQSVEISI